MSTGPFTWTSADQRIAMQAKMAASLRAVEERCGKLALSDTDRQTIDRTLAPALRQMADAVALAEGIVPTRDAEAISNAFDEARVKFSLTLDAMIALVQPPKPQE